MRAAGVRKCAQQREFATGGFRELHVFRFRRARADAVDRDAVHVFGIGAKRRGDGLFIERGASVREADIRFAHEAVFELARQFAVRFRTKRVDHDAAGLFVEPVHGPNVK